MKKNAGYLISIFMVVAMLCGLSGCSDIDIKDDAGQTITEIEYEQITEEDEQLIEKDETASSCEYFDVVVPNPADDDLYIKGRI